MMVINSVDPRPRAGLAGLALTRQESALENRGRRVVCVILSRLVSPISLSLHTIEIVALKFGRRTIKNLLCQRPFVLWFRHANLHAWAVIQSKGTLLTSS
ncbi:hypothetical protein Mapa_004634 [Marchantia paleacea]|nr:hypothetical protein Mapa_004634 [Marchantia paleacea]